MKVELEQLQCLSLQSKPGMTKEQIDEAFEELHDNRVIVIDEMYVVHSIHSDEKFWIVKFWTTPYNAKILKESFNAEGKYISNP